MSKATVLKIPNLPTGTSSGTIAAHDRLAFEAIGLKLDTRIKELILQGETALIVEVLRQLRERDPDKK
jgi:hypothetical protein